MIKSTFTYLYMHTRSNLLLNTFTHMYNQTTFEYIYEHTRSNLLLLTFTCIYDQCIHNQTFFCTQMHSVRNSWACIAICYSKLPWLLPKNFTQKLLINCTNLLQTLIHKYAIINAHITLFTKLIALTCT